MTPLFQTILDHIPPPFAKPGEAFHMLVSNIDWSDYVGRIAIGKILGGRVAVGDTVYVVRKSDDSRTRTKITQVFEYSGLGTSEAPVGVAGNIVGLAGFEDVDIGDTIAADQDAHPLPFTEIDPPTLEMQFCINDGPLAGREGKYVTSRQLRERLQRETKSNVSIKVEDTDRAGVFTVKARGAMQIAIMVETMRREGFEMLVSRPTVITRTQGGHTLEPFETLWIELPEECVGAILQNLANRKGQITNMEKHAHSTMIEAVITTRGLIGLEIDVVNATSGRGVMTHLFKEYGPWAGELITRLTGTLLATEAGVTTAYALSAIQERGKLFVGPGEEVYEGMLVGENPRQEDIPVNAVKAKQLTNFRSQGEGKGIQLTPAVKLSLERAIEYIAIDEFVEATPNPFACASASSSRPIAARPSGPSGRIDLGPRLWVAADLQSPPSRQRRETAAAKPAFSGRRRAGDLTNGFSWASRAAACDAARRLPPGGARRPRRAAARPEDSPYPADPPSIALA